MARALLNQPSVVLADEPTGNLDSENSRVVLQHLKDFTTQEGGSVLLVTHDAEAVAFADRVVMLRDGRIE